MEGIWLLLRMVGEKGAFGGLRTSIYIGNCFRNDKGQQLSASEEGTSQGPGYDVTGGRDAEAEAGGSYHAICRDKVAWGEFSVKINTEFIATVQWAGPCTGVLQKDKVPKLLVASVSCMWNLDLETLQKKQLEPMREGWI